MGKLSEGFSGADISVVIRDALMEPIRMVMKATHFKPYGNPNPDGKNNDVAKVTPCSPGDEGAVEITWKLLVKKGILQRVGSHLYFPNFRIPADIVSSRMTLIYVTSVLH